MMDVVGDIERYKSQYIADIATSINLSSASLLSVFSSYSNMLLLILE